MRFLLLLLLLTGPALSYRLACGKMRDYCKEVLGGDCSDPYKQCKKVNKSWPRCYFAYKNGQRCRKAKTVCEWDSRRSLCVPRGYAQDPWEYEYEVPQSARADDLGNDTVH